MASIVMSFLIFRSADVTSQNFLVLGLWFSLFLASQLISLWTEELHLVFLNLTFWFCIGFLQIGSVYWAMSQNVAKVKWIVLFLDVFLTAAVLFFYKKKFSPNKHALVIVWALAGFLVYLLITSVMSVFPTVSYARTAGFIAIAILSFYLLPAYMETSKVLQKFYRSLWWATNIVVLLSLFSYFGVLPSYQSLPNRFQGIFGNPNGLGPWLNLSVLVNLALFSNGKFLWKLVSAALTVSAVFLLFECNSRANYAGLLVGLLVLLAFSKRKLLWGILFLLLGGAVFFYHSYSSDPIFDFDWKEHLRLESRRGIMTGRAERWQISLEKINENPWYGVGLGAQEEMVERALGTITDYGKERYLFDNSYLNFLYEIGYPGLAFFLFWLLSSLFWVWKNSVRAVGDLKPYSQIALAVSLDLCVVSLFESFLGTAGNIVSLSLWISLGLASVYPLFNQKFYGKA